MGVLIQSRSLELHYQNFCDLSIRWKQIFICRLKSEHNCSGRKHQKTHV